MPSLLVRLNDERLNVERSPQPHRALTTHKSGALNIFKRANAYKWFVSTLTIALLPLLLMTGCATPPVVPATTAAEDSAKLQRTERANANLADATRLYESGNFDESMKNFLLALDSSTLTPTQQLTARKQMAFIHCVSNREANCREEFEKAFQLDAKFNLSPAESGHPIWGAVYRQVKADIEARRSGKTVAPPTPKILSTGEKLLGEAMQFYEASDYNKAIKGFQDALKETLSLNDQITAHKFSAFSYCLSNRTTLCRQEFEKIFSLKADFDLLPAEAGHPSWGPSFRTTKARRKPATGAQQTPRSAPAPTPATAPIKK